MKAFEREFFSLAKWMLGCRLRVMGGQIEGDDSVVADSPGAWQYALLGYLDHAGEMELLCKEWMAR